MGLGADIHPITFLGGLRSWHSQKTLIWSQTLRSPLRNKVTGQAKDIDLENKTERKIVTGENFKLPSKKIEEIQNGE